MSIKTCTFLLLTGVILAGLGCSYTNRGPKMISLTVTPADASVIVNGIEYHHVSPQFIEVTSSRLLLITAYKPGYRETNYVVNNQLSAVGKIDACGSILLFPFFGLFSDGAWELKETNIRITLEPLADPAALTLQQQETIEAKRRADAEFREQASAQGPPPSRVKDEELKKKAEIPPPPKAETIEVQAPAETIEVQAPVETEAPTAEINAAPAAPEIKVPELKGEIQPPVLKIPETGSLNTESSPATENSPAAAN